MGWLVLIVLVAGCYDPTVADCADTCGADHLCPDGLTCDGQGYCRIAGAAGMCGSGSGSGSGPGSGCPIAPMGHGTPDCATAMPINAAAPDCLVACQPAATGSATLGYSEGTWHAARIASQTAETTAKSLATSPLWIGLRAPNGMGATKSAWTWTDAMPATYNDWGAGQPVDNGSAGNCAAVGPGGWMSEPCTNTHGFLIDPNP
jgi:hypothetical protein